jgi:hypothetical protein
VISLLASVAMLRKSVGFVRIVSFVTFAIAGLTLVIVWDSNNETTFTGTFFTWLLIATTLTLFVSIVPEFVKLFAEFLGIRKVQGEADERGSDVDR